MCPTLPAFSALQKAPKGWDPALPVGIQTLLGEAIGLALLSRPQFHMKSSLYRLTRGLKHTKRCPQTIWKERTLILGRVGREEPEVSGNNKDATVDAHTCLCAPWEGGPCLEPLGVSVTVQRLQCFQLG